MTGASPPIPALSQMLATAWLAQALSVAARLGIADRLAGGPLAPDDLAAQLDTDSNATYRLLRALASAGIFEESPDGRFALTALAQPLRSDAPDSIRDYAIMVGERWVWASIGGLMHSVRTGAPSFDHLFGAPVFDYYTAHPEAGRIAGDGLKSIGRLQDNAVAAALDLRGAGHLVDVGGGQGGLLASLLTAHPDAEGVLFDLPHVVAKAAPVLAAAGVAERCKLESGDFFRAVPKGGQLYILRKVLHDWDDARARQLLAACREGMASGTWLVVAETTVPVGNASAYVKLLDLLMLTYAGGRERTEAEYRALLQATGFSVERILPTIASISLIEARRL
ncbi:Dimerisation domain-containing protein [Rhodospirillales bacterium URHD0017]|nr:Dimerisation domain-containing protein [Rhodospirillales bacterium URHD0017]